MQLRKNLDGNCRSLMKIEVSGGCDCSGVVETVFCEDEELDGSLGCHVQQLR